MSDKIPDSQTPSDSQAMGKNMMIIAWVIAIALLTWIFGAWEKNQYNPNNTPNSLRADGGVEVTLERNRYGHYMASGQVNREAVVFMLDTGATVVAIPGELQQKLRLTAGQAHYSQTANGRTKAYSTVIEQLKIGDIELYDVKASIIPNMQGAEILLGMSVLKQLEFTQKGKLLTLRQVN